MWFRNDVNWRDVSYIDYLPDDFVLKYKLHLKFEGVFQYSKLKEKTLEQLAPYLNKNEWYYLWDEQEVSERFIEKYDYEVNWERACFTTKLSEDFIKKHIDKIDWEAICIKQNLSESFLREFADKVFWYDVLSFHENLTPSFVREIVDIASSDYVGNGEPLIENLSNNTKVDKKIFREYEDQLDWGIIGNENNLTEEEIIKWKDKLYWKDVIGQQQLSFPFLKKYLRSLKVRGKWEHAFQYNALPEDFIEQYISKKTHNSRRLWKAIWQIQNPSEQFIRKHIDKVKSNQDWYYITHNPNISIQFFKDFKNYIEWRNIVVYKKNEQFIRELIEACPDEIIWEKLDYSEASLDFIQTYWNKLNQNNRWCSWSYVKNESGFEGDRILPKDEDDD